MQPRTDNLYKFLAIFGLVLIGYGVYAVLNTSDAYSRSVAEWESGWKPLITRGKHSDEDARMRLECAINATEAREAGNTQFRPSADCVKSSARQDADDLKFRELQVEMDTRKGERKVLDQMLIQARLRFVLSFSVAAIGLAVSLVGFWLWYIRLQKHIDASIIRDRSGGA